MAHSFSGEWHVAYPPSALPSPLGPGYRLWRSSCPGPNEQGFPQLPGRLFPSGRTVTEQKQLTGWPGSGARLQFHLVFNMLGSGKLCMGPGTFCFQLGSRPRCGSHPWGVGIA